MFLIDDYKWKMEYLGSEKIDDLIDCLLILLINWILEIE